MHQFRLIVSQTKISRWPRIDRATNVPFPTHHLRWLALALSLAISGCALSPTESVTHGTIDAAVKGKLDDFREQISPDARATLGSEQGMRAMQQELAGYTHISVGPALLVSAHQGEQGYDHYGDVLRNYQATVSGVHDKDAPPALIYTLQLQCSLAYHQYHHDEVAETCNTTIDDNGVPWTSCSGGSPAYDSIDLDETCGITGVK